MILAVSTVDRVGGLILVGLFVVSVVLDRIQRRCSPRRRADAAGLPDTARHCGRVEAGTFPAAEALAALNARLTELLNSHNHNQEIR